MPSITRLIGSLTAALVASLLVTVTATPASATGSAPPAPTNVTATAGFASATVTWSAGTGPETGTPATYTAIAVPGGESCTVAASATTCQIAGLTNGRRYRFNVEARNADGARTSALSADFVVPQSVNESFDRVINQPTRWSISGTTGANPAIPSTAHICMTGLSTSESITLSGGVQIIGCSGSPDTSTVGVLRLTGEANGLTAALQYTQPLPTAGGLDIRFKQAQWGVGGDANASTVGADGISFFLRNGAETDLGIGNLGPGLGYAPDIQSNGTTVQRAGVKRALFGVGLDLFGNFSIPANASLACSNRGPGRVQRQLVIRSGDTSSAGTGGEGFCLLGAETITLSTAHSTRAAAALNVRVVVDPVVPSTTPKIRVFVWALDAPQPETPTLVVDAPSEYRNAATFKFGFAASTGAQFNNQEIWDLSINEAPRFVQPTSVSNLGAGRQLPVGQTAQVMVQLRGQAGVMLDGVTDTVTVVRSSGTGAVTATPGAADAGDATVVITGLTPGEVVLRGSATGYTESGTVSLTVVARPGAPTTAPTATLVGSDADITVASVPVGGAGAISNYRVYAQGPTGAPTQVCTIDVAASPLTCTATGLAAGIAYTFTYRVANAAGESDASPVSAAITTPTPPAPPPVEPLLPQGAPTLTLTGQTFTCAAPTFSRPLVQALVEWLVNGTPVNQATVTTAPFTATLTLTDAMRGAAISCRVTGQAANVTGTTTSNVVNVAGAAAPGTGSPSGSTGGGETSTAGSGTSPGTGSGGGGTGPAPSGPEPTSYTVSFRLFSAELSARERRALRALVDAGQRRFVIASFVPAQRGDAAMRFNLNLSRQRAATIAAFLRGVDSSVRITVLPTRVSSSSARTAGTIARVDARP